MDTKPVDRTQEKVALARELGMIRWADINDLTGMKFKRIDYEQIRKKLGIGKLIYKLNSWNFEIASIGSFLIMFPLVYLFSHQWNLNPVHAQIFAVIVAVICGIPIGFFNSVELSNDDLSDWEENIPYGALLAVKEAKAKGFEKFTIWYPCLNSRILKQDPVITGQLHNIRYEIFSWDDGIIYE